MAKTFPVPSVDDDTEIVSVKMGDTNNDSANFKLFIAAIDAQNQLVYTNQKSANGPFVKTWTPMDKKTYLSAMDCGTTLDGRVAIVAVDSVSKGVKYFAETPDTSKSKNRFLPAENLGTPPGVADFSAVRIARGVNGLDNVFACNNANTGKGIWWKYRNPPVLVSKKEKIIPPGSKKPVTVTVQVPEPPKQPWSDWININGILEGGLASMFVCNDADGRLVLTGNYGNGIAWVSQQTSDDPSKVETWSPWQEPGQGGSTVAAAAKPVLDRNGRISVFANLYGELCRSRQTTPGSQNWEPWSIPGIINDDVGDFAISIDGDGCLYSAVLNFASKGTRNLVYGNVENNTLDAEWSGWQTISMLDVATEIQLDYNADGSLTFFALDEPTSVLVAVKQITQNSTEWYANPTTLSKQIKSFSVTRDLTP